MSSNIPEDFNEFVEKTIEKSFLLKYKELNGVRIIKIKEKSALPFDFIFEFNINNNKHFLKCVSFNLNDSLTTLSERIETQIELYNDFSEEDKREAPYIFVQYATEYLYLNRVQIDSFPLPILDAINFVISQNNISNNDILDSLKIELKNKGFLMNGKPSKAIGI